MATGTVTTTTRGYGPVGLIGSGTATSLQGDASPAANVRVASSEGFRMPNTGSNGLLAYGLVIVTSAAGTAPVGDSCWATIDAGFFASDGVTLRWGVLAATRNIAGNLGGDNAVVAQSPYAPAFGGSSQITSDHILAATQSPAPTFTGVTGVDIGLLAPMTCDAVRVSFYITHGAAATGNWNLQWRLYAYRA